MANEAGSFWLHGALSPWRLHPMLTISLLLAAAAAVVVYQRARAAHPPELGSVSAQWLAEQRASGRQ